MAQLTDCDWQEIDFLLSQSDFEDLPSPQIPTITKQSKTDHTTSIENNAGAAAEGCHRFVEYSKAEADEFINSMENTSTKKKTDCDMRQLKSYINVKGEERDIETIPMAELDTHFGNFLLGARKIKDSGEYEPSTLRGFMGSLDRYLKKKGWTCGVTKNPLFPHSNASLKAKQKDLKSQGMGNRPNEADEMTDADIEKLFQKGVLGTHSPTSLINLLHLNFSLVLGMRGGLEQRQLKWGDIEVGVDEDGDEFLVHKKERTTKTRTGLDVRNVRQFKPKAWNNSESGRCPVNAYKLYMEKRPKSTPTPDSPFFLGINVKNPENGQAWFKNCPMGVNTIYGLTKKMWENGKQGRDTKNDTRKITNHSVRKHLVQKCVDLELPPTETIQITGHKNLHSVNNYSKMNLMKQKKVAKALTSSCTDLTAVQQTTRPPSATVGYNPEPSMDTATAACCTGRNVLYSQQALSSIFGSHASITGGNFYFGNTQSRPCPQAIESPPPRKYRRIRPIIDSDEENDLQRKRVNASENV